MGNIFCDVTEVIPETLLTGFWIGVNRGCKAVSRYFFIRSFGQPL